MIKKYTLILLIMVVSVCFATDNQTPLNQQQVQQLVAQIKANTQSLNLDYAIITMVITGPKNGQKEEVLKLIEQIESTTNANELKELNYLLRVMLQLYNKDLSVELAAKVASKLPKA